MSERDLDSDLEAMHHACFGWALACCAWDREEAEDVLQASYLKALEGKARFNGRSSLRTWFFGVVRKTAAEQRRSALIRSFGLGRRLQGLPASCPAETPETLSREAEERLLLRRCLAGLTRRQRELLHLVFYQEMTIEEASGVLDISLGTARTHYERGKARLRKLLANAEKHDEHERRDRSTASSAF